MSHSPALIFTSRQSYIVIREYTIGGSRLGDVRATEHRLSFTYFMERKYFMLLVLGGIAFGVGNMHYMVSRGSFVDFINSILATAVILPMLVFTRVEVRKLLILRVEEIFSERNEQLKSLFVSGDNYLRYLRSVRSLMFSKKEYILIAAMWLFLLVTNGFFQDVILKGRIVDFLQQSQLVDLIEGFFLWTYWSLVVGLVAASLIWIISAIMIACFMLGKETRNLKISSSIVELKSRLNCLSEKDENGSDYSAIDLSFGKLKEGLKPLVKMTHELSLAIASIALVYSLPAIIYFFTTHDLSPYAYYGFCIFTAVLSCAVLISGEIGIRNIWVSSKDDALVMLEQLCDKVKIDCMKSIVSFQDFHSRENLQKDVTFVRTAIDDLKNLKASDVTMSSFARILTTIILPYIPLIAKLLGLY